MKLYLVGGAVRRHMLGLPGFSDFDFAVEADSYEAMRDELVTRYGMRVWQERPEFVCVRGQVDLSKFGTFGGLLATTPGFTRGHIVVDGDFTLCRTETMYSDKRHPDTVTPCSILEDLSRRDFTVNAVAVREDGMWIDPHHGQEDATNCVLMCVGNTRQRMLEDPLRMLRALRFAATDYMRLDYHIIQALGNAELVELLGMLPHERVREELNIALAADWRKVMIHLMVDSPKLGEVIARLFPNLWFKATTESR